MRGARTVIVCLAAALTLSGCMGRTAPVAVASQPSLDNIAYGRTVVAPVAVAVPPPPPRPVVVVSPYVVPPSVRITYAQPVLATPVVVMH